jgi:hypothetical protein
MDNPSRSGHFLEIVAQKIYRGQAQIRSLNIGYEAAIGMAETSEIPYCFSLGYNIMMSKLAGCTIGLKASMSQ